jgi:hypothetical protein
MAIPYIWLGKNTEITNTGTLDQTAIGTDKWTVRPLLSWTLSSAPGTVGDTFTPALLIWHDNPLLEQLLRLLNVDAVKDGDATVKAAIGDDWIIFRLNTLSYQFQAGTAIDLATLPGTPVPALIPHTDSFTQIPLTFAGVESLGFPVLKLSSAPTIEIATAAAGEVTFTLSFPLQELDLKPFGAEEVINLDGKVIKIAFDTTTGKFSINDTALDSGAIPESGSIRVPLSGDTTIALIVDRLSEDPKIGLELLIDGGSYIHEPLVPNINDSRVEFVWSQLCVRLYDNRLGFVAPPGSADEALMVATFTIPLIQAEVSSEVVNALTLLVPAEVSQQATLAPLQFSVTLKREGNTLAIESPLWEVTRGQVGRLIQSTLRSLKAVFSNSNAMPPAKLSSFFAPLQELTNLAGSGLTFTLETIETAIDASDQLIPVLQTLDTFNTTDYSLPLALRVREESSKSELMFFVVFRLNLWEGRLRDNRAYFYIVASSTQTNRNLSSLDLTAFAIQLPIRAQLPSQLPKADNHDGYLDFEARDVVLDAIPTNQPNRPQLVVLFPGGLTQPANVTAGEEDEQRREREQRRVRLLLEDFNPESWPEPPKNKPTLQLRLGARGVTFAAKADTTTAAKIPVPGDNIAAAPSLKLVESRDGLRSGLVVIDSQVRCANLLGRIDVPGFEVLEADIQLGLRRKSPQDLLEVIATIDLDRSDHQPLAQLKIPVLKAQIDDLRMRLTWKDEQGNQDWKLEAWASGTISVVNDLPSMGGIKGLDQPRAIPFRDLDLIHLNMGSGKLPLGGSQSPDQSRLLGNELAQRGATPTDELARFELLDGQFRVEFQQAVLSWNVDTVTFEAERARFDYLASSGDLDVAIEAGKIELKLSVDARSLRLQFPSSLGLEVRIGTQIKFLGTIGWVDTPTEKYFFAAGQLQMTGFPEVAGMLKLGTGIKNDGSTAPNLAVFAALPYEAELFSGVVMKEVGLGLGLNNRLAALGSRPEPREILARLDQIDPKQPQNWSFVTEAGVYVSVVATTILGSNRGNEICAYIAKLVLSIDTNIDIVAVAQIWLFSSLPFLKKGDNERRPALVGAAVLRAREQTFSLMAQTMPRPAIEANKMLSDLLSQVRARFSFYLSSDLADYYLEELSYSENLFGISVQATGSYRIAIGRFGALVRAILALRGTIPQRTLSLGVGGFTFSGNLLLDADFGGLVTSQGLTAYGAIRAGISFRVSAYILIPTIAFETRSYEKTFSITVSIPYLSCKRWRCKWKTKKISETVKVRVTLIVSVMKKAPYHLPETTLDLLLAGALAFDESGGIGFSGTLAISTTICGHALRIAPRFDYRPEVVDSVRNRVAAVEDRINRLRGLPRPASPVLAADLGPEEPTSVETWYYYTSRHGDRIYHLLVPSPEEPTWWYTPRAADLSQYANLPRDTGESYDTGGASELERQHLSPLRGAVMRMVLPFSNPKGEVQEVIDLAMPWDRANYDALQEAENATDEDELIALVMKLTDIEAAFLNTTAKANDPNQDEISIWESQEEDPNRVSLNGVEIVSDPRPESGARIYWTLTDQMMRPDTALPYHYRPVEELVAEGFSGVDRRGDIGRLLRYEAVRRRAIVQGRLQDYDPRPARKLAQNRASLLSTILADFVRESGPQTYAPIEAIKLVRKDEDSQNSVVARRRIALWVLPEISAGEPPQYRIEITYAILENNTDLGLNPAPGETTVSLEFTWTLRGETTTRTVNLAPPANDEDPARYNHLFDDPIDLTEAMSEDRDFTSLQVVVRRDSPNSASASVARLIFEPLPARFGTLRLDQIQRQVGLFAVTDADAKLQLDLNRVRIIRNEQHSDLNSTGPLQWANESTIRIISMTDPDREDPIAAIQRWVTCLPPCQEFLTPDASNSQSGQPRVRVRLPVKFEEELLKAQLPRLNGFEIYRRFPWENQPIRIAEGVTPIIQRVDEQGRTTLLVESFLFSEEFPYNPTTKRFEGVAAGVIPGITPIEYLLRAIPYGRLPESDDLPIFRRWLPVTLYVPPMEQKLPALGVVVSVRDLFLPQFSGGIEEHLLHLQLVDSRHVTWDWTEQGWEKLEIWAEPRRIQSSGAYALEDEPADANPRVTPQPIRRPRDLTIEQFPESVIGKIKIVDLTPDRSTWQIKITPNSGLQAGRAYRLFIRPTVATETPLVQPMPIYLIREMTERVDETTALCYAEQLELISPAERDRILQPFILNGRPEIRREAWLENSHVTISRLTALNPALERLRIAWDHLSDLDAGVEILIQDEDESHRLDRRMVTVQEEAVFQTAIRDFRNPDLWQPLPGRLDDQQPSPQKFLDDLRSTTPHQEDEQLLLWRDEQNLAIERIHVARERLKEEDPPSQDQEKNQLRQFASSLNPGLGWGELHRTIAEYQFALLAFQRTPLAPATPEEREGLNALAAVAHALILGIKVNVTLPNVPPDDALIDRLTPLKQFYDALTGDEAKLRTALNELAAIDLSAMTVMDTEEDYERVKTKLQDIDLARKFAEIIELRLVIANDLLDPDTSNEDWAETLNPDERLPKIETWGKLLENYNAFNSVLKRISIATISKSNPATVTTSVEHRLNNSDRVLISGVVGMVEINNRVSVVEVTSPTEVRLVNIDSTPFGDYISGGSIQREFMEQTQKLLTFFDHALALTSIATISKSNPATVTTSVEHRLNNSDRVLISGVVGMVEINNRVSVVEVTSPTEVRLVNIDSTPFGDYISGGSIQREFMATGQQAATEMMKLLDLIRDPSVQIFNADSNYGKEIARLVPQAAGLTAALDSLRRDAQAWGWTLLRRPHNQLGIKIDGNGKREPVFTPLSVYLPANLKDDGSANTPLTQEQINALEDSSLVMPFVNLLERFGFAVDLAVVDALNQPLPQARLIEWIAQQPWSVIRSSIRNDAKDVIQHEVVLITGREPYTDRDLLDTRLNEDQPLGYAFVKLAVVPHSVLIDLLQRDIEVSVTITTELGADGAPGQTIVTDKSQADFTRAGWTVPSGVKTSEVKLKSNQGVSQTSIVFNLDKLDTSNRVLEWSSFEGTAPGLGDSITVKLTATAPSDQTWFRKWLQQRSMLSDEGLKAESTLTELSELKILKRVAEAWWKEQFELKENPKLKHITLETRSHRWATVPVLGGRAHIDWQAFDSAGHAVRIAVRRVSRYEALMRWASGTASANPFRVAVPTLSRIHGLTPHYYQVVNLKRRMRVGVEEPTALSVFVSPHPTRINFVYALPTSGARATISGLSARRSGYQGITAQFFQERLQTKLGEINDVHAELLKNALAQEPQLGVLILETVTDDNTWEITSDFLAAKFEAPEFEAVVNAVVVFSPDFSQVRLSREVTFTASPKGTLKFSPDEGSFPNFLARMASSHMSLPITLFALAHPTSDPELSHLSLKGTIQRTSNLGEFRLTLDPNSDRLEEDSQTYIGQVLIVLDGDNKQPIHTRLIAGFDLTKQTLTFGADPLPDRTGVGSSVPIRILVRAKPLQRTAINRSEAETPVLFRNERLISLPALPYYRQYSVELNPQFNITEIEKLPSKPTNKIFGQRRPSIIGVYPAHLSKQDSSYTFRLALTRQGDLLTPAEREVEKTLANKNNASLLKPTVEELISRPDNLPDLGCQYQVVWQLSKQTDPASEISDNVVYAELFDLILPGHPLWTASTVGPQNHVLVRNRVGESAADFSLNPHFQPGKSNLHVPISVWWPGWGTRPVYVVRVKVTILQSELFGDPSRALLQVQRDGYRSRFLPISLI